MADGCGWRVNRARGVHFISPCHSQTRSSQLAVYWLWLTRCQRKEGHGQAIPQGDRKGPHPTPHHTRPYNDHYGTHLYTGRYSLADSERGVSVEADFLCSNDLS